MKLPLAKTKGEILNIARGKTTHLPKGETVNTTSLLRAIGSDGNAIKSRKKSTSLPPVL